MAKKRMDTDEYGLPKGAAAKFFLEYQDTNLSLEEVYFWLVDALRNQKFKLEKTVDTFSSSVTSSFGGASGQKLSINQDRAMQYLKYISDMVKSLFQVVRELRVIDERMDLYEKSQKGDHAAEVSLRGYWVDLVEGGSKNPGSVFGLAASVGFATLPDLFFSSPAMKSDDVEKEVAKLEFNDSLKNVLKRKLMTYMVWKERTYNELMQRRGFTLHYLKQHYSTIKLYIDWLKPYLKNARRLQQRDDPQKSVDIINAFESSVVEIEFIAIKGKPQDHYVGVLLYNYFYRVKPQMSFTDSSYQQRGPIHVGRVTINMCGYIWTKKDLYNYRRMKVEEDFELLGELDETVKEAVSALGDQFLDYLKELKLDVSGFERDEDKNEKPKPKPKPVSALDPFLSVGKGLFELFTAMGSSSKPKNAGDEKQICSNCGSENSLGIQECETCGADLRPPTEQIKINRSKSKSAAKSVVSGSLFLNYKNFKKAHGMIQW